VIFGLANRGQGRSAIACFLILILNDLHSHSAGSICCGFVVQQIQCILGTGRHWLQRGTLHSPQHYPLPLTDPQTQLPASSLEPFDLPPQTASISDQPFCHNTLDRQTQRQTGRWLDAMFDNNRPLSLYRKRRRDLKCSPTKHYRTSITEIPLVCI